MDCDQLGTCLLNRIDQVYDSQQQKHYQHYQFNITLQSYDDVPWFASSSFRDGTSIGITEFGATPDTELTGGSDVGLENFSVSSHSRLDRICARSENRINLRLKML